MNVSESLEALRHQHQALSREYDRVLKEIEGLDMLQENTVLRQEIAGLTSRCNELENEYRQAADENMQLKLSLQEQILDEKLNILKVSREKLDTYFTAAAKEHENSLTEAESRAKWEIEELKKAAAQKLSDEMGPIIEELNRYGAVLQEKIRQRREDFAGQLTASVATFTNRTDELAAGEISDEIIRKRIKQNEIEAKIGLNWVNKLGIILILFGVGAAAQYSYAQWFGNHTKGTFIFLLGGLLLAGGEWFYRQDKEVFAAGLLGGGISVLYCGVFYSYFLLNIIGLYTGMALSVLVTAAAVTLAVRYRSQTICGLGLVGGYLPFFSYMFAIGLSGDAYYTAMGYLFLLNLAVMLVSFRQKWNIINYISMLFHAPSLLYLVFGAASAPIGIVYAAASFATYLAIILAYPLTYRQGLGRADTMLLGFNTVFSCGVIYWLFQVAGWSGYNGLLALGFCLIYAGLARLVESLMSAEKYTLLLFYVTSLTFAVLMIPFQLGVRWMSMGWLIESLLFIIYGLRQQQIRLEKTGWIIFGLCLISFYLVDWFRLLPVGRSGRYFDVKYFAVMAAMLLVTVTYLSDLRKNGVGRYSRYWEKIHWFKYFTVINLWYYLVYTTGRIFDSFVPYSYYSYFYRLILAVSVTLVMAYCLPRIALLRDKTIYYFSLALYTIAVFAGIYINATIPLLRGLPEDSFADYGALAVLAAYNLMILLVVRETVPAVLKQQYLNFEIYPLLMLLVILGNTTVFLMVQFSLESTNLIFSFIYLFAALLAILYGFRRKYVHIRRVGLGLALLSTTKLFIFDLAFLTSLYKILAYFCFGFVLLGISYLYQRLMGGREDRDHGKEL